MTVESEIRPYVLDFSARKFLFCTVATLMATLRSLRIQNATFP